tara:strand:+ start:391 stop:603 length:213 start_codon:yes stop_codon:yes gene_type:complete
MKLLEIMKEWGVNDTPNDIRHFEEEVGEHYQKELKEALKLALACFEQNEYWAKKPEHTIKKIKDAIKYRG